MTTWLTRCFAGLLLVLPFVPAVADDADDKEIARLVKQLGSSDYRTRDAATKRLQEIGEPTLDALAKVTDTLEARRRAEAISAVIENTWCVEQLRLTSDKPGTKYTGWGPPTVSVSTDGKRLLTSGHFDPILRLWDLETGKELRVLEGNTSPVLDAALSPDGTRALAGCYDTSVRLWDATTGKILHRMEGHEHNGNGVRSVAFGPEGQGLSGAADGLMVRWDLNTGKKAGVFTCGDRVVWVAYLEKSQLAASTGVHHPTRLWDLETGKEVCSMTTDTSDIFSIPRSACFSPDGKRLAVCHHDRKLRIFDVDTNKELLRIDLPLPSDGKIKSEPYRVASSPDGKRIALARLRSGIRAGARLTKAA